MRDYQGLIAQSGLGIYDPIEKDDDLFIHDSDLQHVLISGLIGLQTGHLPNRTRSRFVKEKICEILGYPIPKAFKKVQPRFPGQNFDVYIQKSNNLQIWNEEITADRRYVILKEVGGQIQGVRVIKGATLTSLDKTGRLTIKHQAKFIVNGLASAPLSRDTKELEMLILAERAMSLENPTDIPDVNNFMYLHEIYQYLFPLVGKSFRDAGVQQERNRGAILHKMVCKALGYPVYQDNGQFPDLMNQLLEVKLQTSPTIDLGLVSPNSLDALSGIDLEGIPMRNCDVRYALFYGQIEDGLVRLTNLYVVSGESFFQHFPQFQGLVQNKKIQIPLPKDFFSESE